jgi:hypothetical protein
MRKTNGLRVKLTQTISSGHEISFSELENKFISDYALSSIQRRLRHLVADEIVDMRKVKNERFYTKNSESLKTKNSSSPASSSTLIRQVKPQEVIEAIKEKETEVIVNGQNILSRTVLKSVFFSMSRTLSALSKTVDAIYKAL